MFSFVFKMEFFIKNVFKTLLHLAVEMNHIDIVKLLLSRDDVDINIRTVFK